MHLDTLTLARDGAERRAGLALPLLGALDAVLAQVDPRAGVRLHGLPGLADRLGVEGPIGRTAASVLGEAARPVRAILFDKNAATNWALGWHQDRTIAVAARHQVPHFGPWTLKQGIVHVAPPFAVLAEMLTLRIHLDPVDADNAPLLIAPGSHRSLAPEREIAGRVAQCGTVACLAERGDVWLYATPILHASEAAHRPRRRRVLQIDYAARALPAPLQWLGI